MTINFKSFFKMGKQYLLILNLAKKPTTHDKTTSNIT